VSNQRTSAHPWEYTGKMEASPGGSAPTYDEAMAFWYGRVNYEQRAPKPSDLRLDRMRELLRRLGDPHRDLRIVHVAGSKGKGSVCAMLAAILQRAGYRTGLFTSPHLTHVEERFIIDGRQIEQAQLTSLLGEIRLAVEGSALAKTLTFFEIATAVGFLYFARAGVGAVVLEVGLGGRFDSTNVCTPAVALISSISIDHTRQLGDRLESIAFEKAGIVKAGRPTISAAMAPEARRVIERACTERGSRLRQLGIDFRYEYKPGRVDEGAGAKRQAGTPSRVQVMMDRRAWPAMELALLGEHQAANAAVVVACVEELRDQGWDIPDDAVGAGLAQVHWPARMEVVGRRPWIVLDCAHNVASAEALMEAVTASFPPARRRVVFAASADKDLAGMFRVLAPHFEHAYLTRYQSSARGASPEELARNLTMAGRLAYSLHATPAEALHAAREEAGQDDLICITGSVFLAGEVRPLLVRE
jgi:dihydrofolate synthase / folylpolyglutamate synthase